MFPNDLILEKSLKGLKILKVLKVLRLEEFRK